MISAKFVISSLLMVLSTLLPGPVPGTEGLEGIEWVPVEIEGMPIDSQVDKLPNFILDTEQQKISGFAGCNVFNAEYTVESFNLRFGPIITTRRACPGAAGAIEKRFLEMLDKVRSWKLNDEYLLLMDEDGAVVAQFSSGKSGGQPVELQSLKIHSTVIPSSPVVLSNGEYRGPAAPGSASGIVLEMTEYRAFGELNGNDAGAVILSSSTGGSGSFQELALLVRTDKGWENNDTVLLGDRVNIHSVAIRANSIIVSLAVHAPDDPMCCPTLETTKTYRVQGENLEETYIPATGEKDILTGNTWKWIHTLHGDGKSTAPADPEKYTIQFGLNGEVDVKADCNGKSGNYSVRDGNLSVKILISTMAMCEEGSLETQFERDLKAADRFFLKDGELYISLKYDSGTMRFSRHPQ